jgi:hypothetical protein
MAVNITAARLTHVLDYLVQHYDTITRAHINLGVPLDDLLCSAVRLALRIQEVDPRQLQLPGVGNEPESDE